MITKKQRNNQAQQSPDDFPDMARCCKVVPSPAPWDVMVIEDIDSIVATGVPIKRKLKCRASRLSHYLAMPLCCGLCCVWSTAWRFICCPYQCACNGAGYICSNNNCTDGTDECLAAYVKEVDKEFKPTSEFCEKSNITNEMIERVFKHAHVQIQSASVPNLYTLFDYLKPFVMHMLASKSDYTHIKTPKDMSNAIEKYYRGTCF